MSVEARGGSRFWQGMLIGAAAGLLLGILLAPQEGERTRQELKERLGDMATAGAAIGGLLADVATDTVSAMASQVQSVARRVREGASREGVRRVVDLGREAASREVRRLTGTYRALSGKGAREEAATQEAQEEAGPSGSSPAPQPT